MQTRVPRLLVATLLALLTLVVTLFVVVRARSLAVPCRVLPQEYCRSGVPVFYGSTFVGLGFRLPAGTPAYAPFEGVFRYTSVRAFGGGEVWRSIIEVVPNGALDDGAFRMVAFGALAPQTVPNTAVPAGEALGIVSGESLSPFGDATFVISFERYSPSARFFTHDPGLFSELFPGVSLPDPAGR